MIMNGGEKSDEGVLPLKRPNKGGQLPAEAVEGRTSPKGNGSQTDTEPGCRVERAGSRAPSGATM